MSFRILKGKIVDEYFSKKAGNLDSFEVKVIENITKVIQTVSNVKFYLLDHFLFQIKSDDEMSVNGLTEIGWYYSSLETGFYQLSTNHLYNLFSPKCEKQVSIDYILGQLIENAKMKRIQNILNDEIKIKKLEHLKDDFYDLTTKSYIDKIKILRDGNTAHNDVNYNEPQIIKIKEVYELFYKANNNLLEVLSILELETDALTKIIGKQFLYEIDAYLKKNNIFK